MAAVLDALASSLSSMLTDMAKDEVGMLLGVSGEIQKMESKLRSLKDFLADAERKRITDKHVQGWVGKLKDVMYDATDVMELCQLKAMKRQESVPIGVDVGCWSQFLFCLHNPPFTHDIGRRIRELNQRLEGIKKESEEFNFINLASYEDHPRVVSRPVTRKTAPGIDRSVVVGDKIEEDTKSLVEMLVKDEKSKASSHSSIKVIAIVGTGGIGKTTLAQMIFNNETIDDKFDKKIWLSVNQDFDEVELLRTAITAAGGDHHGDKEISLLQPTLSAALEGKKLFLVMDDVWSDTAWYNVLRIPLTTAAIRGSSVLVTTRDERVARRMKAMHPYHHVDKLGPQDAWSLLKNQVASTEREQTEIEKLKNIGLGIVERCDGLPLAVKAIGGLLSCRDINESEWEKVLKNPSWSVMGTSEELNHAIYLSYEDLNPALKQCFVHLSLLPKDSKHGTNTVVGMWISEGFVDGSSNELEDLGEEYYKELIMRNLIAADPLYPDQSVWIMHDVVRSFAHCVSRDEALVLQKGPTDFYEPYSLKVRRLSIELKGSGSNQLDWSVLQKQKALRTLILDGSITFKPNDSLSSFSSLRTIYIAGAKFTASIDFLCQLKHLRFLHLKNTDISRLPEGIGNMKFLQRIALQNCENTVQIPGSIIKLGQLRSLSLSETKISAIPRGFGGLTNLKTLSGFPAHMDPDRASPKQEEDWCSLEELGSLSQLRKLSISDLENVSAASFAAKAKLAAKENRTFLGLRCTCRLGHNAQVEEEDGIRQERQRIEEDMFDELCPPSCLDYLAITGYFGCRPPSWMMSPTSTVPLKGLRLLFLEDLPCCTQLPDGLCHIPCLECMQVLFAPSIKHVGPTFVQGQHYHRRHHHPSRGLLSFPRLRKLNLIDMVEWEEWEWDVQAEVQAMSLLEELSIRNCKLRSIPPGLCSHAISLRGLRVSGVPYLKSLESFCSVLKLVVIDSYNLVRIGNFPKLQKLSIVRCPKLNVLEDVPALHSLKLKDYDMDTLPEYLKDANPERLELDCSIDLLTSLAMVSTSPEWGKISHIRQVKAYARDGFRERGWYLLYKQDPYSLETNIRHSSDPGEDEEAAELTE